MICMDSGRRTFLLSSVAAPFVQTRKRTIERPNLVLFMTDDHGAWATGAYGARDIRTPHIDGLAATGARFTRAFAATPVCSPSRMTWMTGCLPATHHVEDWLLPEDSFGPKSRDWLGGLLTWPEVLKARGYTTAMCGKWHMGHDDQAQRGFTEWATVPGGSGPYRNPTFVHNGHSQPVQGFKEDALGDFALAFLTQQKNGHNFALLMPFYAPHTPFDFTPDAYRAPYLDSTFPDFPNKTVHTAQNPQLRSMHGNRNAKLGYSSLVTAADANIGRVLQRLDELRLRDNTLVIFSADQGWCAGHHGVWGKGNGTVPYNMYEESIRVPLIWNHPRVIRPAAPTPMVSSYDFFPTLLDYLGIDAPAGSRRVGRSYAGFLRGAPPRQWTNRLFFEYSYVRALRTQTLKYVERSEGWPSELYDLEADPAESTNVIDAPVYRSQREALRRELEARFKKLGAPSLNEWRSISRQIPPAESHGPSRAIQSEQKK